MNGNFVRIIKSKYSIFDLKAIITNYIALFSIKFDEIRGRKKFLVLVRDLNTDREIKVTSFSGNIRKSNILAMRYEDDVFIKRTKKGNLLVGYNNSPKISIYSHRGKKIKNFRINIKPVRITKEMKEEFYTIMEHVIKKKPGIKPAREEIKEMRSMMHIFPKYTPYYEKIIIDDDGNILVFYHNGYAKVGSCKFQVYSSEGKYICDSEAKLGKYQYYRKKGLPMVFNKNSIYFYPEMNDIDDENLSKVIRVRLR